MRRSSQATFRGLLWCIVPLLLGVPALRAEDAWYEVPVDQLEVTEGELPRQWAPARRRPEIHSLMLPYAVLEGEGEVYVGREVARGGDIRRFARQLRFRDDGRNADVPRLPNRQALAVRAPQGKDVTGSLYVPDSDYTAMVRVRFRVPAERARDEARQNFFLTKAEHYETLVGLEAAGGAWFRHQALQARNTAQGRTGADPVLPADGAVVSRRPQLTTFEDTFQVFSGGRAISENLQLDRLLQATKPGEPTVDITTLEGITVREMDWSELTKDIEPRLDLLAECIPADQHALFFPSFPALLTLADEAMRHGTPVLDAVQPRAEDYRSRAWYERQLCLSLDTVSRQLGERVVQSAAFTGSDPYLRTGSDVAVLFGTRAPQTLTTMLAMRHQAAEQTHPGCKRVNGSVAGVEYTGVVTPDRSICSYMAQLGDAVAVTNSLVQLERLAVTTQHRPDSLASLPEYRFFRDRYRLDDRDETALLIVTDATIRRWCGPKWRIASSRRTRAAAVLAHYQAEHLDRLVAGRVEPRPIETALHVPDLGRLQLTPDGVVSSTYGTLDFQTPILELDLDKITEAEARSYRQWRDGYERNWRQFFDPIAVRFSVRDERLAADVTVMPLIEQSDYNQFIELVSGASIRPDAGDRHSGALLHWTMAINPKAAMVRQTGNFLENLARTSPFAWLGESLAVYADADPFWSDLAEADAPGQFTMENIHRLPVAVRAEVANSLKLALFLTGLRGMVEQTAPGLVTWETLKHHDISYTKVAEVQPGVARQRLALYYAATPRALTITFSESLLKRALDREAARAGGDEVAGQEHLKPWLGESLALQIDARSLPLFEKLYGEEYRTRMQARAWGNLPVLNEWKRRFPQQQPLTLHEERWQARLRCPGGGRYVWNEQFQTMESTVYGHPGNPQDGPAAPPPLKEAKFISLGVTFEHDGLRARAEIDRTDQP